MTKLFSFRLLAILSVASLLTCPAISPAQAAGAWDLITQVQKAQMRVKDYVVPLTAIADIPGMKTPEMKATIYYKYPDKLQIKSEGFAMIPRDVISLNVSMLSPSDYDAVLQGSETVDGVECRKVKLLALADSLTLQRLTIFIDPVLSVIRRMETDPGTGSSAVVSISYKNVKTVQLPDRIIVDMDSPPQFRMQGRKKPGRKETDPGKAHIELRYGSYKINSGLDDSIFENSPSR